MRTSSVLFMFVSLLVASCTAKPAGTAIYLAIDTHLMVPAQLDRLDITAMGGTATPVQRTITLEGAERPIRIRVDPGASPDAELVVTIAGTLGGQSVLRRRVRTHFDVGHVRVLPILLSPACARVDCAAQLTCITGSCESDAVDATRLADWTGDDVFPARVDASYDSGPPPERIEDWSEHRRLVFRNGGRAEDLLNFPLLVRIDAAHFGALTFLPNGDDLRFTDGDGTFLDYEIETWNPEGTSYVWVRVPQIDRNSTADYIELHSGNAAAKPGANPERVWSSDFAAVYHMVESTHGTDSTANHNHILLTLGSAGGASAGLSGSATRFGPTDFGRILSAPSLEGVVTVSATFAPDVLGDFHTVVARGTADNGKLFYLGTNATYGFGETDFDMFGVTQTSGGTLTAGNWNALDMVITGTRLSLYSSGVLAGMVDYSGALDASRFDILVAGDAMVWSATTTVADTAYLGGVIDELRLLTAVRSAAYLDAEEAARADGIFVWPVM
jgi:Domain of unknown function (DUF2341)/Concanavalin A-like lectin/glucanases superfamily